MSKHVSYGKTFGRFYEAYRNFCRENSETGKPTSETPSMFQDWFYANVAMCMDDATTIQFFLRDLNGELTECLIDSGPHDVKTENNRYLNTSEKVLYATEKAEAGVVIPHFHRGYFKRLSNDFYKNKKGQIVFVHEIIVNGVVKTQEK